MSVVWCRCCYARGGARGGAGAGRGRRRTARPAAACPGKHSAQPNNANTGIDHNVRREDSDYHNLHLTYLTDFAVNTIGGEAELRGVAFTLDCPTAQRRWIGWRWGRGRRQDRRRGRLWCGGRCWRRGVAICSLTSSAWLATRLWSAVTSGTGPHCSKPDSI